MDNSLKISDKNTYISIAMVIAIGASLFWIGWQVATLNLKIDNLSAKVGDNNQRYDAVLSDHEIRLRACEAKFLNK
jgi:hypothetical protein